MSALHPIATGKADIEQPIQVCIWLSVYEYTATAVFGIASVVVISLIVVGAVVLR
jgi:hypothetical protein